MLLESTLVQAPKPKGTQVLNKNKTKHTSSEEDVNNLVIIDLVWIISERDFSANLQSWLTNLNNMTLLIITFVFSFHHFWVRLLAVLSCRHYSSHTKGDGTAFPSIDQNQNTTKSKVFQTHIYASLSLNTNFSKRIIEWIFMS